MRQPLCRPAPLVHLMYFAAAPLDPGWFERVAAVLHALMTLAILVLTVAVVPTAWNFRKSYQKVSHLLERVYADVAPITHHATRIAENVDYVTTAVRSDLARVTALVERTERRIDETLGRAEARARDLEALLHVAQTQAEDSFVAAAATVAGVREGFASLRDELAGMPRARAERDDEPLDARRFDAQHVDSDVLGGDVLGGDVLGAALTEVDDVRRPRIRTRDV